MHWIRLLVSSTNRAIRSLFYVQVFFPQFVKTLLIEYAFIPKPIGLLVELCLEMAGQHFLYLACVGFAVIEREKFQQMLLRRG